MQYYRQNKQVGIVILSPEGQERQKRVEALQQQAEEQIDDDFLTSSQDFSGGRGLRCSSCSSLTSQNDRYCGHCGSSLF